MTAVDWIDEALAGLPPILTVSEAMRVLRSSSRNLRRMVGDGRIQGLRSVDAGSSRVLIPRVSVERYLRALAGEQQPVTRTRRWLRSAR